MECLTLQNAHVCAQTCTHACTHAHWWNV